MDTTVMAKISYGLYVLGTKMDGKDAGCVVDAFIQSTSAPTPTIILCSIQKNQTNEAIKKAREFTVSVLPEEIDPFVVANFGFQSGRDIDKWAQVPHERMNDLPILTDAAAYFHCRVIEEKELSTHTAFFCEIIDTKVGAGEPLTYAAYQKTMKQKSRDAFSLFTQKGKVGKPESKWVCQMCGYVYDEEEPFENLPDSWVCPLCGAPKSAFVKE